jgi:hypothetical protein
MMKLNSPVRHKLAKLKEVSGPSPQTQALCEVDLTVPIPKAGQVNFVSVEAL